MASSRNSSSSSGKERRREKENGEGEGKKVLAGMNKMDCVRSTRSTTTTPAVYPTRFF